MCLPMKWCWLHSSQTTSTANYACKYGVNGTPLNYVDVAQPSLWWDCCSTDNPVYSPSAHDDEIVTGLLTEQQSHHRLRQATSNLYNSVPLTPYLLHCLLCSEWYTDSNQCSACSSRWTRSKSSLCTCWGSAWLRLIVLHKWKIIPKMCMRSTWRHLQITSSIVFLT